jgi:hypothetical protein
MSGRLDLRLSIYVLAGLLTTGVITTAEARQQPTPPSSGIVVHLFGPSSVMSNMLPTTARPDSAAAATPAGAAPSNAGYAEPSMGDVMHQMFVTGDPNAPPKPSTGRTGQRLAD